MKTLVYTFRTFPWTSQLPTNTFVFGSLKQDFEKFKSRIEEEKPDLIIGIAKNDKSYLEPVAINKFNKGKINPQGLDYYPLYIPPQLETKFSKREKPTHSFCNWTMYKIAEYLSMHNINSKFVFLHLNSPDIDNIHIL